MPKQQQTSLIHAELSVFMAEIERLKAEIASLQQDNSDLEIALTTAIEHGDAIEEELAASNRQLHGEIKERMLAEARLEKLISAITRQKQDLELLVQTITEHSDELDADWLRRYAHIERLSLQDGLTGLANRRRFDQGLDAEWRRCQRNGSEVAVLICDIDFFKLYNDRYGHIAGDEALRRVAQVLDSMCKRPGDLAARYGGEELALLLPGADQAAAVTIAELLRQKVWDLGIEHGDSTHGRVSISIGVAAMRPNAELDALDLISTADGRLYSAKARGRNMVVG